MIEIPFLPEFKEALASGKKTATTRNKRYAKRGSRFTAFGMSFELLSVGKVSLWMVAYAFYEEEGLDSPEAFIDVWNRLHRRKKYEDDYKLKVWLHLFRRVE